MYAYLVAVEVLEDVEVTRVVWEVVVVALFVDGPDCEELEDIADVETVDKDRVEVEVDGELVEMTELLLLGLPV